MDSSEGGVVWHTAGKGHPHTSPGEHELLRYLYSQHGQWGWCLHVPVIICTAAGSTAPLPSANTRVRLTRHNYLLCPLTPQCVPVHRWTISCVKARPRFSPCSQRAPEKQMELWAPSLTSSRCHSLRTVSFWMGRQDVAPCIRMCIPQRLKETWNVHTVSILNFRWIFTILSVVIKILSPAATLQCTACGYLKVICGPA